MRIRLPLILGVLLLVLSLVLAARSAGPVGARTGVPQFVLPQTAHLQFDTAMHLNDRDSANTLAVTMSGQGDYDGPRRAAQLQAEIVSQGTEAGVPQTEQLAVTAVAVDGKLYWRDPIMGTWTWAANTAAQGSQTTLSPDMLGLTGLDGVTFVALRKEALGGTITTHWHADLDVAALLAAQAGTVPSDPAMPLPQLTASIDLWIGDTDGYLHRMDFAVAMTVTAGSGPALALDANYAMTFSNFDQPVTIVAPAGAVPASTEPTSATPSGALAELLPAGVGSSLSALPLGAGGSALAGLNGFGGASVAGLGGQSAPSSRPAAQAAMPTATATPRPSPKTGAPTATVALAANVVTGGAASPAAAVPAAGALEAAPSVLAANDGNRMLILAGGIGVLLVGALGLVTFGWRMSRR